MKERQGRIPAKILMFGEYSILVGSTGLSIPYFRFGGSLITAGKEPAREEKRSGGQLKKFHDYLHKMKSTDPGIGGLDLESFKVDLDDGQYFSSDIPVNHGLGSSGALVAAVYDKYGDKKSKANRVMDLGRLRLTLGKMESFFHGTSSGLDPLTSLIQKPLLVLNGNKIITTPLKVDESDLKIFLLDTGVQGKTGPLVRGFLQEMKEAKYAGIIENEYIPVNNRSVHSVVNGDNGGLMQSLEILSRLQLQLFPGMIPRGVAETWEEGLNGKKFFLKLCGSGGGGYLLGFTTDLKETGKILSRNGKNFLNV